MEPVLLNVDDDEIGRYARTRFLSRAGFHVLEAGEGLQGLQIARERKPDLILLDVNLPDVDGFEVCRLLRSDPETERIPVIFLTASKLADPDVVEGLEAGADNYLREPVDPDVLIANVRALLRAREAEDALARSNEQLSRFAFVVSHELQEPLRMVKTYSQLLTKKYGAGLEPDALTYLQHTVQGAERMERFIQDMLRYSRISEGDLQTKPTRLEIPIQMALMELDLTIKEHGAIIEYSTMPTIEVDSMRMAQVFRNLIGNAIKYRSETAPAISISAEERSSEFVITVNDNGIGIDPVYSDEIFVLFKRLHGRDKSGSGVGLAICKQIVEQHGGAIWVVSKPGQGSQFCFTLPKASAAHA